MRCGFLILLLGTVLGILPVLMARDFVNSPSRSEFAVHLEQMHPGIPAAAVDELWESFCADAALVTRPFSLPNATVYGTGLVQDEESPTVLMVDDHFKVACIGTLDVEREEFHFMVYANHGGTLVQIGTASGIFWNGVFAGMYIPKDQTGGGWDNIFDGLYFPDDPTNTGDWYSRTWWARKFIGGSGITGCSVRLAS